VPCGSAVISRPIGFVRHPGEGAAYDFGGARGADIAGQLAVMEVTCPVGLRVHPHVHKGEDEMFYLLEGELRVVCGGQTWTATPGSFAFVPRDVEHSFQVTGATPARMLTIVGAPASPPATSPSCHTGSRTPSPTSAPSRPGCWRWTPADPGRVLCRLTATSPGLAAAGVPGATGLGDVHGLGAACRLVMGSAGAGLVPAAPPRPAQEERERAS
jgi:quercetin dioxygenase-like cupin family protein